MGAKGLEEGQGRIVDTTKKKFNTAKVKTQQAYLYLFSYFHQLFMLYYSVNENSDYRCLRHEKSLL